MCSNQPIEKPYDEARRLIQQAEREKRLVFFVGAGASIPSGMPSWGEAIGQVKARMGIAAQTDFLKIPQYYYLQYGKRDYTRLMRDIFQWRIVKSSATFSYRKLHREYDTRGIYVDA